ncbi:uncharacterized protein LOC143911131 [Arctopsyche grandis]|uniref:uncharacterized protein LOC143911131 n=1 Tax=Arctopsyche grandis TaxID=121162 RepID=UPI00406D661F
MSVRFESAYYKKYLESFPLKYNEKNNSVSHNENKGFIVPLAIRKYKKVRKKYSSKYAASTQDEHSESNNDEQYYVGFTKNPFGHSSPFSRSKISKRGNLNFSGDSGNEVKEVRDKRGVAQLYNMISCATGCDPISYKGYGCYCGFLGAGQITDSIDRCCMLHDVCYNTVDCPLFLEYFMPYLWKCWRGEPLCAIDHLDYGDANSCAARLCECDRQLAVCLSYSRCPQRRALCTSSPWRLLQNILMF